MRLRNNAFAFRPLMIVLSVLVVGAFLVPGCASSSRHELQDVGDRQFSFWPQFPAEPRVQFLVAYKYSSDIEAKASKFDDLIYGKDSSVLPINKPYGVEMWDGKIYVCDIRNPGLVVLDLKEQQTRIMTTQGLGGMAQPTDVAVSSDGMKYVADAVRGVIFVFDKAERHVRSFGHEGFKPVGIAVYEDELFVCDFATQSVLVLDRYDGTQIRSIGGQGGDDGLFIRPLGVDVDKHGNVYVGDVIKCRMQVFTREGELINAYGRIGDTAGSFVRPKHIGVDSQGLVYVADAAFDNVQMFNDQGQVLMFFGAGGGHPGAMNLPAGIAVNETDMELFKEYIHPAFKAERLVLVTNQFGPNKVSVFAVGELREGMSVEDIAMHVSEMPTGVQTDGEVNPLTGDLQGGTAIDPPARFDQEQVPELQESNSP